MGKLLWVDDDEERFAYERFVLCEQGWAVDWATTVEEAATKASAERYDVVVLDQMVPCAEVGARSALIVWSGGRLLWWLRGRYDWEPVPGQKVGPPYGAEWSCLAPGALPSSRNLATPVLIVSGIYEPTVFERMHEVRDDYEELTFLAKPLEPEALLRVVARKASASVPP